MDLQSNSGRTYLRRDHPGDADGAPRKGSGQGGVDAYSCWIEVDLICRVSSI